MLKERIETQERVYSNTFMLNRDMHKKMQQFHDQANSSRSNYNSTLSNSQLHIAKQKEDRLKREIVLIQTENRLLRNENEGLSYKLM